MTLERLWMPWRLVLGVFLASALSIYWFSAMAYQTDSISFVNGVLLWAGEPAAPDRLFRLSKPLSLLLPLLCYQLLGLSILSGLFLQQYLAYWGSSFLVYRLLHSLFPNLRSYAAFGTLAFLLCQPMAVYGLAFLTDGLGWCLLVLGILWSQRLFQRAVPSYWKCVVLGVYLGTACFVKESVVVAGLFAAWLILLRESYPISKKMGAYGSLSLGGLVALVFGNLLTYFCWGSSLLQWIQFGQDTPPLFSWRDFLAQAYHTLDAFWWLFALGVWTAWQRRAALPPIFLAYAATILSGWLLLPLTWPYLYDRILFMLVPPMLPFIAFGALRLGRFGWLLLLLAGISQLWVTQGIYFYQRQGWIVLQAWSSWVLHGCFFGAAL